MRTGHSPSLLSVSFPGGLGVEVDDMIPTVHAKITVAGELDCATAPRLAGQLQPLTRRGYQQVDVDMRQVSFCDAAGLSTLMTSSAQLRSGGGHLTVWGPCPALQHLLAIMHSDSEIQIDTPPP